ncbi:DUF5789 family protein [Halobacterium litoreum]|uniref:Uncharacterized protein n=1 Tax=Halobacterium litoreum TaxID=2039234 RepID=A0ABD5NI85_9EURY|nr:hypothetical protein [Halobacterium litoreum]UHH12255.1 hypothetical protein LT972_08805 [Halobacterium litoreum]
MAARPPTDSGDRRDPDVFGIAAVDEHLADADLSFPATPEDVVDATGDPEVLCAPNGHGVALSSVLERTGRRRFDSRQDLLDELHEAFEQERRDGVGIVAWLRSLVGA